MQALTPPESEKADSEDQFSLKDKRWNGSVCRCSTTAVGSACWALLRPAGPTGSHPPDSALLGSQGSDLQRRVAGFTSQMILMKIGGRDTVL
ncbi:hypothetical protein CRUP_017951 [Coryphaenoides rupestris]|nr:hypothetical protein CRUP_017951 [Coryphaenoides rupestris]